MQSYYMLKYAIKQKHYKYIKNQMKKKAIEWMSEWQRT